MTSSVRRFRLALLTTTAALTAASAAVAQGRAPTDVEELVVVGSQIQGAKVTAALPVTVVSQDEIVATGAVSGDDLYRSIPQMGDVSFNSTNGATSSNFARGDVGSVNLRNLGVGNTLVLLNGRRVVAHPGSQAERLVPVLTYNTNAIPVAGLARLEVLRDGAAAIYGSDAVAGVVNNVLRNDIDGGMVEVQYGGAEGANLHELEFNAFLGRNFQEGRGNVSLFFNHVDRSELAAYDFPYSSSSDKRPLFVGTRMEGLASLDLSSTLSSWADLRTPASFGTVRSGTVAVTSAGGQFHIQPTANGGCQVVLAGGVCIDDGSRATAGADRNTRFGSETFGNYLMPKLKRTNVFLTGRYDLTEDVEAYGEFGYYEADTHSLQDPVFTIGSTKVTIPASNYYNPFGPTVFANGQANPNRLPNLNAPAAGLPVTLFNYRFVDMGQTEVDVETTQVRALAGLRGEKFGFRWDSAFLYSEAKATDVQDGISSTLLQRQLALSTPDAYNPFSGGSPTDPRAGGDPTPSSQAALDAIRIKTVRKGKSTLALWDFKVSKADLFALPAGDIGMAAGVELRRESQLDDRDPRVDGTITFTDAVTGEVQTSDLFGVSPTPDTKGSRKVGSAFVEFAAPIVSPDMNIPLVRSVEMQLAGRYEHYSDFGDVAKPKVAVAWDLFDGLRLRGSWAQGFRAPNLEQINATLVTRGNTRTDYIFCEADLRAGRITSFANCARSFVATAQRAGNPDLKPEESENWTLGVVFQPRFLPPSWGDFTFTADYWSIKQKGIVGVFGEGNGLILDYLQRVQGQTNPKVVRAEPTADDIAVFAGTGLAPVGQVIYVQDQYVNLEPQDVRGLDLGLNWRLNTDRFGAFNASINAAHLIRYYRAPSPDIAALLEARASGVINAGTVITEGGDLVGQQGRPEWKWSASLTWRYDQLTLGAFTQYTHEVQDDTADAAGVPWVVESQITANLFAEYAFKEGWASDTRVRVGARNIFDKAPPLAVSSSGYLGALYQPYGRYWYASIRKSF
ncbi:TonB-dependent receptor domain-containing protein [Phenylobacterium sp.]|uniref:TonB-dependent receptor domain-containing protein n=1 Tax=Phenylobacterium sp. TaxID=1871053 RepID=UPI0039280907